MRLINHLYSISILIFAFSVCVTMQNLSLDDDSMLIYGQKFTLFLLPLFVCNIYVIFFYRRYWSFVGIPKSILVFSVLVLFATVFHIKSFVNIIQVLLWSTSYFASYIMVKKDPMFANNLLKTFIIVFILSVFSFIQTRSMQYSILMKGLQSKSNSIFCVISVLPFLLLCKSNYLKYLAIFITLVTVLFSNKRSAYIIFALAIVPTLWTSVANIRSKFKRYSLVMGGIVLLFAIFNYITNRYVGNFMIERFSDMEDDGGSGRDQIWGTVIVKLSQSNVTNFVIGHGHKAVSKIVDFPAAHNDFLDVIYDYGIFALFAYIHFHILILKQTIAFIKSKNIFASSYYFQYVVFLVMSLVSILLTQQRYLIYMAIFWGMIEALNEKQIKYSTFASSVERSKREVIGK